MRPLRLAQALPVSTFSRSTYAVANNTVANRTCLHQAAKRLYSTRRSNRVTRPDREAAIESVEDMPDEEFLPYMREFEARDAETVARITLEAQKEARQKETETLRKAAADVASENLSVQDSVPNSSKNSEYPDLMEYEPLLDSRQVLNFAPDKRNPYGARVVLRNDQDGDEYGPTMFEEDRERRGLFAGENYEVQKSDLHEEGLSTEFLPLSSAKLASLYKFPLVRRRVVQQTAKGRIVRKYCMMIVGDGNGLLGMGEAKAHEMGTCLERAFGLAVKNMDYVERFENRTVWTETNTKLGSTRIILRPRPVGFGLRCNPNLHQVFQAAGIKDISAKVWGSRNPINVIKAAFRMLQAGNAPLGMGDGVGGKGRKLTKGWGARSSSEIEMQRGRKLLSLRT